MERVIRRARLTDITDKELGDLKGLLERGEQDEVDNFLGDRLEEWNEASCETRTVFESQNVDNNSAFQVKGNRRKINKDELYNIKKGDHIGFHRPYVIWHHAIVADVDDKNKRLQVIHYKKKNGEMRVVEEWINVKDQPGHLYVFDYDKEIEKRNHFGIVLQRARKSLGSKGYQLLGNNCEHFASSCKTGKSCSYQVRWVRPKVFEIVADTALSVGKVAAAELTETFTWDLNIVGAFCVAILEIAHCIYDIYRLYKAKKYGEMKDRDFKVSTTQRVVECVCGAACAIVGGLMGGPIMSIALGTLGSLVGKLIGSMIGTLLGEWLW